MPQNRGSLGMDVERAQQITDSGMTFDIIRVTQVRPGLAGARAGLHKGDQIIALDGRVFSSLAVFAAYVGSLPPSRSVKVDFIPAVAVPRRLSALPLLQAAHALPLKKRVSGRRTKSPRAGCPPE